MAKLKIAYFGSPDFSARFLEKLLNDDTVPIEIVLVVTQSDKPAGRKGTVTAVPVKQVAQKYNIPVIHSTEKIDADIDLGLLFAYGQILPSEVLRKPKYGFWNIHPSLLPLYRGASPIATPLIEGKSKTGVTLIKMDEQIDHGPIIAQETTDIGQKEKRPELTLRLTDLAFNLFKKTIQNVILVSDSAPRIDSGQARMTLGQIKEQDHTKATYTKLLTKQDGYIPINNFKFQISNSPQKLFNRFRGLYPWPGIWTLLRLKASHFAKASRDKSEGQAKKIEKRLKIIDMDLVNRKIHIKKVQLEGKTEVDYKSFKKAYEIIF